ncbi:MAG: hypothetical protein RLO17_12875 [Cyclobacteriaceae bacterium]
MLSINGQENMVADSVKFRGETAKYIFELTATDPDENLKSISYEIISGNGSLFQNGIITDEIKLGKSEFISMEFAPSRPGTHILNFSIVDVFDQEASITLDLYAFENIVPVSRFEIVKPEVQHDPLEYMIDASSSYDPDEKFGGGIISYEYSFLGKTVKLSMSVIGVIFPEPGTYDIGVRVKDNDGKWSEIGLKTVLIND